MSRDETWRHPTPHGAHTHTVMMMTVYEPAKSSKYHSSSTAVAILLSSSRLYSCVHTSLNSTSVANGMSYAVSTLRSPAAVWVARIGQAMSRCAKQPPKRSGDHISQVRRSAPTSGLRHTFASNMSKLHLFKPLLGHQPVRDSPRSCEMVPVAFGAQNGSTK